MKESAGLNCGLFVAGFVATLHSLRRTKPVCFQRSWELSTPFIHLSGTTYLSQVWKRPKTRHVHASIPKRLRYQGRLHVFSFGVPLIFIHLTLIQIFEWDLKAWLRWLRQHDALQLKTAHANRQNILITLKTHALHDTIKYTKVLQKQKAAMAVFPLLNTHTFCWLIFD